MDFFLIFYGYKLVIYWKCVIDDSSWCVLFWDVMGITLPSRVYSGRILTIKNHHFQGLFTIDHGCGTPLGALLNPP